MPKIDLTSIPGLETAKGLYGSITSQAETNDSIVDLMVLLYESVPPPPPPGMFF